MLTSLCKVVRYLLGLLSFDFYQIRKYIVFWSAASIQCISNGILFPKLFWPSMRKDCFSDREKLLKFMDEGWDLAKVLRSLE